MEFFDFHHHHLHHKNGIYNLNLWESVPDEIPFSVGLHPKDITDDYQSAFLWVQEIANHQNVVAIGECGLDALISVNGKLQLEVAEKHIELANKIKKPVILHCVRRYQEIIRLQKKAKVPLIIHGFNKNKNLAKELLQHQFYLSFGKAALQHVSLQELWLDFPLDRIFLESDDADFDVKLLYDKLAEIKGISTPELEKIILQNLEKILKHAH